MPVLRIARLAANRKRKPAGFWPDTWQSAKPFRGLVCFGEFRLALQSVFAAFWPLIFEHLLTFGNSVQSWISLLLT
jgi:hypothetical protein